VAESQDPSVLYDAYKGLGEIYEQLGEPDESIQAYLEATRLSRSDAVPVERMLLHHKLGRLYLARHRYEEAERALEVALRASNGDPTPDLLVDLGKVRFLLTQNNNLAMALFEHASGLTPYDEKIPISIGQFYLQLRDYSQSMTWFRRAVQTAPTSGRPLAFVGMVYHWKGENATAIDYFRMSTTLNSQDPYVHYWLSLSLIQMERYDDAIESLVEALDLMTRARSSNADKALVHIALGDAYGGLGETMQAVNAYREALKINPGLLIAQDRLEAMLANHDN
jgi:tetratricopeptide (TPR) repeat protein